MKKNGKISIKRSTGSNYITIERSPREYTTFSEGIKEFERENKKLLANAEVSEFYTINDYEGKSYFVNEPKHIFKIYLVYTDQYIYKFSTSDILTGELHDLAYSFQYSSAPITPVDQSVRFSAMGITFEYPYGYLLQVEEDYGAIMLLSPLNSNRMNVYNIQDGELKLDISKGKPFEYSSLEDIQLERNSNTDSSYTFNRLESKLVTINDMSAYYERGYLYESYIFFIGNRNISINKYPAKTSKDPEFEKILSTLRFSF